MSKLSRAAREAYAEECIGRIISLFPYNMKVHFTGLYDKGVDASCEPENEYFRSRINVNLDDGNATKRDIAWNVFHECQHILVFPIDQYACRLARYGHDDRKFHRKQIRDTVEYVVTSLQHAYFGLVFPEFAK